MFSKQSKISIAFHEATVDMLSRLAKQEHKTVSSLAKELILDSLEHKEDIALSEIARARDVENAKRIKHTHAW
jgi:hypothetical protein